MRRDLEHRLKRLEKAEPPAVRYIITATPMREDGSLPTEEEMAEADRELTIEEWEAKFCTPD